MAMTLGELHAEARSVLRESKLDIEPREAGTLLARVLNLAESLAIAHPEQLVEEPDAERFLCLVKRRAAGEPFAYLIGEREFFGRSFLVDQRVLIPRPETEHLVEAILERNPPTGSRVIDIGTGSGCIALTIALERPDLRVYALDVSLSALAVAAINRRRLGLSDRVHLLAGDLLDPLASRLFSTVLSNPPYVAPEELELLSPEVADFEPHIALLAAASGHEVHQRLLRSPDALRSGARLVIEIGAGQLGGVLRLAEPHFEIEGTRVDYGGHERVVELRRR